MAGEALGTITCDGCGGQAAIKKISNSSLLYLHCKKCGCDRRSGALVQEKWQNAISQGGEPEQAPESSINSENPQDEQWHPSRETHSKSQQPNAENPENSAGMSGKKILGFAALVLGVAGMAVKAIKQAL